MLRGTVHGKRKRRHAVDLVYVNEYNRAQKYEQIRRQYAYLKACEGISTHALEYGVIGELVEVCEEAIRVLDKNLLYPHVGRDWELLQSRLTLVLTKLSDKEPEK
jgi:hypothetical protein